MQSFAFIRIGLGSACLALWSAAAAAGAPLSPEQPCGAPPRFPCRSERPAAPEWRLPAFELPPEPAPDETLAGALAAAFAGSPELQAGRYALRATDEGYAQALAGLRPTASLEIAGGFDRMVPGRVTRAQRGPLTPSAIESNTLSATASAIQPLTTGGRASAEGDAALADSRAGRARLRGTEGDLLLAVVTAYADVRRDAEALRFDSANLREMEATLGEIRARAQAGELTRTDIAQAETQTELFQAQYNAALEQHEADRARYAALVGHDPGVLAEPPALPGLPGSVDDAFDAADAASPELAAAIAAERASRARIAVERAAGRPTLSLSGSARVSGGAVPFALRNDDQEFAGRLTLTMPLFTGGLVSSRVAQARDRNAADAFGIESARREMVRAIVTAWNELVTARRNLVVGRARAAASRVLDEGTYAEYRAGLRSTFDVLYAHASRRDAEVAQIGARRDAFVAGATLLRRAGLLDIANLLGARDAADPLAHLREVARRRALPFDFAPRWLDAIEAPAAGPPRTPGPEAGGIALTGATIVPAAPTAGALPPLASHSPQTPPHALPDRNRP